MAKITGKEGLQFRGPARVFDSEEAMIAVVDDDPQKLKVRPGQDTTLCLAIIDVACKPTYGPDDFRVLKLAAAQCYTLFRAMPSDLAPIHVLLAVHPPVSMCE